MHVEPAEAQREVPDVEGGEAVLEVAGQSVALLAPLVGAAGIAPDPPELGVEFGPDLVEPLIEPFDVGALRLEVVGAGRGLPTGVGIGVGQVHLLGAPEQNANR